MLSRRIYFGCSAEGCDKPNKSGGLCAMHYNRKRRNGDISVCRTSPGATKAAILGILSAAPTADCVYWEFGKNPDGYGVANVDGRKGLAHRYICEAVNGPQPRHKPQAAHSCGNGRLGCVNPKHLRWADASENQADKLLHGTDNRGEKSALARITQDAAEYIFRSHERVTDLARMFNVSKPTICDIKSGRSWAWLNKAA